MVFLMMLREEVMVFLMVLKKEVKQGINYVVIAVESDAAKEVNVVLNKEEVVIPLHLRELVFEHCHYFDNNYFPQGVNIGPEVITSADDAILNG